MPLPLAVDEAWIVLTDLERIGDEASKIARTAKNLHERGATGFAHYDIIRTIGKGTSDLLHDALDAFARLDGKQAMQIIAGDEVIDHYVHTANWEQFEYDRRITDWELKRGFERY